MFGNRYACKCCRWECWISTTHVRMCIVNIFMVTLFSSKIKLLTIIYIVTIFMVTIQVGSYFPNMTNKVKKKKFGPCISNEMFSIKVWFILSFQTFCFINWKWGPSFCRFNDVTDIDWSIGLIFHKWGI